MEEGVLDKKDCEKVNWGKKPDEVDYEKIYKGRYPLLRKAYENSDISKRVYSERIKERIYQKTSGSSSIPGR